MTDAQQPPLVEPATVSVGRALGSSIEECVRELTDLLADASRISDTDAFVADVMAREAKGATVLPGGVALPHARSAAATVSSLAVARLPEPVQLADGEPTDLIFLIAVPGDAADRYLTILREAFDMQGGGERLELYFGATNGEVFGSADAGATWSQVGDHLPPIYSVRTA